MRSSRLDIRPATLAGVLFLLFQVAMIVRARFDPDRYFCWAPHDSQNEYEIAVVAGGRELQPDEVSRRYRLPYRGVDPRAIEHIFDIVRHYEGRLAREPASVTVRYRVNGSPERTWRWPEP